MYNSTIVINIATVRKYLLVLFAIGATQFAHAQFNQDWGLNLGLAMHMGDIGGVNENTLIQASRANYNIGAFYRYKLSSLLSVKGALTYARISGDDKYSVNDPARRARNLNFRTDIFDFAVTGEVHVLDIKDFGSTGRYNTFFNLYGFLGVGVAYFEPKGETPDGEWVKLRPLKTEGESYSAITPVFPIGIGSHMTFDRKWRIGVEIGARYTLTDYLDDVSTDYMTAEELSEVDNDMTLVMQNKSDQEYIDGQIESGLWPDGYQMRATRGGPTANDWYFFGQASVSFLIRGKSNFYRARYNFSKRKHHKRRRARAKF